MDLVQTTMTEKETCAGARNYVLQLGQGYGACSLLPAGVLVNFDC